MFLRRFSICCSVVLSLAPIVSSLRGASATWDSSPVSNDWNTALNWSPDSVPNGPSDVASFFTSSVPGISLSADVQLAGMTFNSGASAFTISNHTISISGGITNNSSNVQKFTSALTLTANQTFAGNGSAILQFGSSAGAEDGAINLQAFTLTTTG